MDFRAVSMQLAGGWSLKDQDPGLVFDTALSLAGATSRDGAWLKNQGAHIIKYLQLHAQSLHLLVPPSKMSLYALV